jgi:pyrroline-5-carboxylate reductase
MSESTSEIGLIGLAVMGQNLALNIADHGFKISVYNRTTSKMEEFVAENPNTPGGLEGCETLEGFVQSLKRPRKVIILVQAGWATDKVIEGLSEMTLKVMAGVLQYVPIGVFAIVAKTAGEQGMETILALGDMWWCCTLRWPFSWWCIA